jgi:hypothetical protein
MTDDAKDAIIKPITITPKEYAQGYEFAPINEPLGAIVMAFTQLEAKLTMTINALLGIDYPSGIALEDLMQSTITRIKLFHTLAVLRTTGVFLKKISGTTGLRSKLLRCNDHRNDYIHGVWTGFHANGKAFQKVRYKADAGLHPVTSTIDVTVDDLWRAHNYIFSTALDLESWRSAFNHRDNPGLWPASWRESS